MVLLSCNLPIKSNDSGAMIFGKPVQVRQMFQSLSDKDRELQIQIGLDTLGSGNSFVTRNISSFNPHDQTVQACSLTGGIRPCFNHALWCLLRYAHTWHCTSAGRHLIALQTPDC